MSRGGMAMCLVQKNKHIGSLSSRHRLRSTGYEGIKEFRQDASLKFLRPKTRVSSFGDVYNHYRTRSPSISHARFSHQVIDNSSYYIWTFSDVGLILFTPLDPFVVLIAFLH